MKNLSVLIFFLLSTLMAMAQPYSFHKKQQVYKEVAGEDLEMTMYFPELETNVPLPVIVFFFGGGWVSGSPSQFELQAEYLVSRGIVVVCPEYRTKNSHQTTPFESVKDARTAIRFLKMNAANFGIDPDKIVVAGGSAGGHLAACTAALRDFDEENENLSYTATPFALILFNPVVDTGKKGYGQEKIGIRTFEISPVHNIRPGLPPVLIMHGRSDTTVPYENVVRFTHVMKQEGNSCKLKGYARQQHGFFNYNRSPVHFKRTLGKTEKFLEKYDLLRGTSWLGRYYKELKISR